MIEGTTASGFHFSIEEKTLDNMELVDAIAEVETNPTAISTLTRLLLGDQRKALYNHLQEADGRVPIARVSEEVVEILTAGGKPAKN